MKAAVIGAGNWGINLVRTLNELGALAGVAEGVSCATRTGPLRSPSQAPIFESHQDLLASDISAVCIATPASTHFQVVKEALLAGKDVFVEKPFTLGVEEACRLTELAQDQNKVLMVGQSADISACHPVHRTVHK